jgi:hypothetical protein
MGLLHPLAAVKAISLDGRHCSRTLAWNYYLFPGNLLVLEVAKHGRQFGQQ